MLALGLDRYELNAISYCPNFNNLFIMIKDLTPEVRVAAAQIVLTDQPITSEVLLTNRLQTLRLVKKLLASAGIELQEVEQEFSLQIAQEEQVSAWLEGLKAHFFIFHKNLINVNWEDVEKVLKRKPELIKQLHELKISSDVIEITRENNTLIFRGKVVSPSETAFRCEIEENPLL